jgi:lipoprotein-anchoring transpeptidase ErfK/SrfK
MKGSPALRTTALPILALLAFAPAAAAQVPQPPPPPPPPPPPAPEPAPADLRVAIASGVRYDGRIYTVPRDRVRVNGRMNAAAAGERVIVELRRKGKRRQKVTAKVRPDGRFRAFVRPPRANGYQVRVVHRQSDAVAAGNSERVGFKAVQAQAGLGSGGPKVAVLQRQLAELGYAVPKSGRYDSATGRAVLAYRKVNRMSRIQSANWTIFRRVFRGKGAYKLKYPNAGKHVEADLSRQVLVLAQNGKPFRTYHTSSGAPSTPTVRGSYRFYRKGPGYNGVGMYYSSYFIRGYAIHGYHSVPTYNASHGCLRVPLASAVSIYNWISLGDRIFVYG